MRYYNCRNGQIVYEKPAGVDFGTEHSRTAYSSQHTPRKGNFSTQGLSYPSRPRNSVPHQFFPQAQNYDYAFCFLGALYLSCSRSYEATADFLLNIIGAWDTGNDFSGDALFVFEMELYPVQIEFYVSKNGQIREISRFNQKNGDEVGIPVEPDGLLYTMCQVYMNFSPVNFSGGADNRDPLIQKAIFIGQQADYRLILDSPFNRITEDPSAKLKLIGTWGSSSRSAGRSDDRSGDTGIERSLGGFDLYQFEADCAQLKMLFFLLQAEGKTAEAQDCLRRLENLRREQGQITGSIESYRGCNDEETLDNIRRGVLDRISGCEEFARWLFEELDAAYEADFDYASGKNTRKFALETGIRPNCFKGTLHGSSSIDGADGPQQFLFLAMEHFFGSRNLQQKVSYRISIVKRIMEEGFKLGILAKYADEKKTAEPEQKSDTHSAAEKKHSDTSSHQNTENSSSVFSKNETVVLALVIGLVLGLSLSFEYRENQESQAQLQPQIHNPSRTESSMKIEGVDSFRSSAVKDLGFFTNPRLPADYDVNRYITTVAPKSGEILHSLAERTRDVKVTINQQKASIFRKNFRCFVNGRLDSMSRGCQLRIPSAEQALAEDKELAKKLVAQGGVSRAEYDYAMANCPSGVCGVPYAQIQNPSRTESSRESEGATSSKGRSGLQAFSTQILGPGGRRLDNRTESSRESEGATSSKGRSGLQAFSTQIRGPGGRRLDNPDTQVKPVTITLSQRRTQLAAAEGSSAANSKTEKQPED